MFAPPRPCLDAEHLEGVFCLPCASSSSAVRDDTALWTGLRFRVAGSPPTAADLRVNSSAPIPPELIGRRVRLAGHMSTFEQWPLFEASSCQWLGEPPREPPPAVDNGSKSKRALCDVSGRVVHMSPVFHFRQAGQSFFLELHTAAVSAGAICVLVTGPAVHLRPYIQLGEGLRLARLKQCLFESSPSAASAASSSSGSPAPEQEYIYLLDECFRGSLARADVPPSRAPRPLLDLDQPLPLDWVQPGRHLHGPQEAQRRYSELDIVATVEAFHSGGWMQLQDASTTSGATTSQMLQPTPGGDQGTTLPLQLYLTHRPATDADASCRPGAVVRVHAVLPVYLWGTLRGFAATSRTHVQMEAFAPPVSISVSSSSSSSGGSSNKQSVNAPSARGVASRQSRSHALVAWRVLAKENLEKALATGRHAKPRGVGAVLACIEEPLAAPSSRLPASLLQATTLPRPFSVQEEFFDAFSAELYSLRAGLDSETLDAALPKVWPPSALREFAERLVEQVAEARAANVIARGIYVTHCYAGWADARSGGLPRPACPLAEVTHSVVVVGRLTAALVLRASGHLASPSGMLREDFAAAAAPTSALASAAASAAPVLAWIQLTDDRGCTVQVLVRGSLADDIFAQLTPFLTPSPAPRVGRPGPECPVVVLRSPRLLLEESPHENYEATKMLLLVEAGCMRLVGGEKGEGDRDQQDENDHPTGNTLSQASLSKSKRAFSKTCPPHADLQPAHFCSPATLAAAMASAFNPDAPTTATASLTHTHSHSHPPPPATAPQDWARPSSSVRHALMVPGTVSSKSRKLDEIVGVVLEKAAQSSFKGDSDKRRSAGAGARAASQQVVAVLRDLHSIDTIRVYLTLSAAEPLVAGMVVSIRACTLGLSAESLKPYIKLEQESSVGVLGLAPAADVESICARLSTGAGWRIGVDIPGLSAQPTSRDSGPAAPPRTTISELFLTQLYNRCAWSLLVRTVFVKKVQVFLQCSGCIGINKAVKERVGWVCAQCQQGRFLRPVWSAVCVVDDGTSEAVVYCDGPAAVLELIKPPAVRLDGGTRVVQAVAEAARIKDLCEVAVRQAGVVKFDSDDARARRHAVFVARQAAAKARGDRAGGAGVWSEDDEELRFLASADDVPSHATTSDGSGSAHAGRPPSAAETALEAYILSADSSAQRLLACRLIFKKQQRPETIKLFSRKVRVQQVSPLLFFNTMADAHVTSTDNLCLQALAVQTVSTSADVREEAWRQLAAYMRDRDRDCGGM